MKQPPIEMRWGGGKWPTSFKRAARPWVSSAIDITQDALKHFNVGYEAEKIVTVWCVGRGWDDGAASAEGTSDIELYLPYPMLKRKKVGKYLTHLTLSMLHEATHCIRAETIPQDNLVERVVTEGIAITSEQLLSNAIFTPDEIRRHVGEFSARIDPSVETILLDHLLEDAALETYLLETKEPGYEETIEGLYRAWFDGSDPTTLGAGSALGLNAVSRLLETGVPFSEVISLPTEAIVTLPTQIAA